MAEQAVLHVGTMKSGTSYLQDLLFHNKAALTEQGFVVPGRAWREQAIGVTHFLARRDHSDQWDRIVSEVRTTPGTAVLSMERLGASADASGERLLSELGVGSARVVISARDLNRALVSMWQETIQNGRTWTWAEYLEDVQVRRPRSVRTRQSRDGPGATFWRQQDLPSMVRAWQRVAGVRDVTVVTVPPTGAPTSILAERFGVATGTQLDPTGLDRQSNAALGLPSVLALRRVNELLDERDLSFPFGARLRKHVLAKTVLAGRRDQEPTLGLPASPWVLDHHEQVVRALEDSGVDVVGALDDLTPVDVPGLQPEDVAEADLVAALVDGLAGLVDATAGPPPRRPGGRRRPRTGPAAPDGGTPRRRTR